MLTGDQSKRGRWLVQHIEGVEISFFGGVILRSATGELIDLRSQRAQALLGILAVTRGHEKDRRLLQEMLWPERAPEQAQNSLRQEIARIRKITGLPELLISKGAKLGLNTALTEFDIRAEMRRNEKEVAPAEFLEGLSLSETFDGWLAETRAALAQSTSTSLKAISGSDPDSALKLEIVRHASRTMAGDVFLDRVARGISDGGPVRIVESGAASTGLRLHHGSTEASDQAILRQQLLAPNGKDVLWSSEWIGGSSDLWDDAILREGYLTQQAILEALGGSKNDLDVSRRGLRAIGDAFSHEYIRMADADVAFQEAFDATAHPAFLSWRAFLLTGKIVERHTADPLAMADEALRLAWEAVEQAPNNSAVLAAASHVMRVLSDDAQLAAQLAEDAIRINPTNPLAWSSSANALMMLGMPDKARMLADRALRIARNSTYRFWWEMNACVCAVMVGDAQAGLRHAQTAHRLKPEFKPPLRYLVAMNLAEKQTDDAMHFAAKLQALEPDFEIRLFHEPDYPTGTLRNSAVYVRLRELDLAEIEPPTAKL